MNANVKEPAPADDPEVHRRIAALSDEALAKMLVLDTKDYRQESIAFATAEMENRKLTIDELKNILKTALNRQQSKELHDDVVTPGIRGWLILPAMGMIVNPFFILKDMIEMWYSQQDASLIFLILALDLVMFLFVCATAYAFFLRKRRAPRMVIAFLCLSLVVDLVIGAYVAINYDFPLIRYIVEQATKSFIMAAVWIPCFLFSERVKRTFTRE